MSSIDKRISDHLVRLVGIMFGVVVAQSFVRYDHIIVAPFEETHRTGLLALGVVYFTVVMSWVDWHTTMELRPYALHPHNSARLTELIRLWADIGVVATYAYLLLTIEAFGQTPSASIEGHLVGYPLIFLTYFLSGASRRVAYGRYASNVRPIIGFGVAYLLLLGLYSFSRRSLGGDPSPDATWLNAAALGEAFLLMVLYRMVRRNASSARKKRKEAGKVVGIDVDGVLANQIEGIIPRVRERTGIELGYEDVTEWKLPLGHTDIAKEILAAMDDDAYILDMPTHPGAREVMEELFERHKVYVLTARPNGTEDATRQWLLNNKIPFDRLVSVKEEKKSLYGTDILVDDYLGNVVEFLENTNGWTVLVDQPWNRNRKVVEPFICEGRLLVVADLQSALSEIQTREQPAKDETGKWRRKKAG